MTMSLFGAITLQSKWRYKLYPNIYYELPHDLTHIVSLCRWWPEVPVIFAIILATAIMGSLCFRFYQTERRTIQYTGGEAKLSKKTSEQACWFVVVFYITWVPYLTLQVSTKGIVYLAFYHSHPQAWTYFTHQYMLSSGKGYDNYGLILCAATMVPLQGFWNCCVYIRPRYSTDLATWVEASGSRIRSSLTTITRGRSSLQMSRNMSVKSTVHPSNSSSLQRSDKHDHIEAVS